MTAPYEPQVASTDKRLAAAANPLQSIARGSVWTIATRWCMRGIGLVNTVVLARLLSPGDFGIVAMAIVAWGLLQVFSDTGQTLAIIRHPDPTREHFDTAWTMSVITGLVVALVLVAAAPIAAQYFHEPRLVSVVRFIALAPLIEGFANVAAVAGFRRSLQFHKDFGVSVISKFSTVAVAVLLALVWRNYWVLAIGIVCGRVATVIASYCMDSYRPRFRLTKWGELWSYSMWIQIAAIGQFVSEQTDQVIVGHRVGAVGMGAYNVAADLAAAPTEELVVPMARATFPVYATLVKEPARLAQSLLKRSLPHRRHRTIDGLRCCACRSRPGDNRAWREMADGGPLDFMAGSQRGATWGRAQRQCRTHCDRKCAPERDAVLGVRSAARSCGDRGRTWLGC